MHWRRIGTAALCGSALAAIGAMYWSSPVLGVVQKITAAIMPKLEHLGWWKLVTELIVWGVVTLPGVALAVLITDAITVQPSKLRPGHQPRRQR